MPETLLQPPVVCCGKAYGSQRALDAHRGSHRVCPSCSFAGSKFALSQHTCGVEAPAAGPSLPLATTAEFTRKDGSFFTVVDEAVAEELPLETRFPGARIVRAVPPPASGGEWPEPQPSVALPAIAVPPLDDEWRVVLVLGLVYEADPSIGELAARAKVSPSDLLLALASGAAGALAFTSGVSATLVGVMVAVALLPPPALPACSAACSRWLPL